MKSLSFTQIFSLLFIVFAGILTASALSAWTGPTATAPGGNVAAPVNVGTSDQVKNAGLSVNALGVFGSGYIQNKLGIGNPSPSAHLDITGASGTDGVRINTTSASANTSPWGIILSNNLGLTAAGNAGYHGIEVDYAGNFRIERPSSVSTVPDLVIAPNGAVGIDTNSPQSNLTVNGQIGILNGAGAWNFNVGDTGALQFRSGTAGTGGTNVLTLLPGGSVQSGGNYYFGYRNAELYVNDAGCTQGGTAIGTNNGVTLCFLVP